MDEWGCNVASPRFLRVVQRLGVFFKVDEFYPALRAQMDSEDPKLIIGVSELVVVLVAPSVAAGRALLLSSRLCPGLKTS